jgi:SAM-dependent methyltransferase
MAQYEASFPNGLAPMSEQAFLSLGKEISREAGVEGGLHGYFVQHAPRLFKACRLFDLLDRDLGSVLEIGPFFGYTPFLLRPKSTSYTIIEGDDPAVNPLRPIYQARQIEALFMDLFESFGQTASSDPQLPFADGAFDRVLCWETMEHFNFNPVKFVRELLRVLRPGGRACITVPNKASLQRIFSLVSGHGEKDLIDGYYNFEDYRSGGKKAFYGFHWREYSAYELGTLFSRVGFVVEECTTFVAFQPVDRISLPKRVARLTNTLLARFFPRYGTHVCLIAAKEV